MDIWTEVGIIGLSIGAIGLLAVFLGIYLDRKRDALEGKETKP